MGMGRPVPRPRKLRPRNTIKTRMASRPRIRAGRHPRSTRRSSHGIQHHVLITKSPPNVPKTRANPPRRSRKRAPPSPRVAEISTRLRRPANSFPAARRPRPATSSPPSARSRPSRANRRPATAEEKASPCPLLRLWSRRPLDLSRSGHRQVQGRRLAGPRRGTEDAAHARRIRQRQAHHLQRLLHVADRHRRRSTRRSPASACPPTPRSWNRAAAPAIS